MGSPDLVLAWRRFGGGGGGDADQDPVEGPLFGVVASGRLPLFGAEAKA